jgi:hypothetical protein
LRGNKRLRDDDRSASLIDKELMVFSVCFDVVYEKGAVIRGHFIEVRPIQIGIED